MGLSLEACRKIVNLTPYLRPAVLQEEEREEACEKLLKFLLREKGMIAAFSATYEKKRELVRCHMNTRAAHPIPFDILEVQDALFWSETLARGVVHIDELPELKYGISTWEGDITRLDADAVVNSANKGLLGCFLPGHRCIDNTIHSFAGMQMRDDCAKLMAAQGTEESGDAKITRAYNLPSKYVIHTVGPMVGREVKNEDRAILRSCYNSVLNLADEMGLKSVAFCCIGTGVFNFPHEEAAGIATGAVINWKLRHPDSPLKIIFNTFLPADTAVYRDILARL